MPTDRVDLSNCTTEGICDLRDKFSELERGVFAATYRGNDEGRARNFGALPLNRDQSGKMTLIDGGPNCKISVNPDRASRPLTRSAKQWKPPQNR